MLLSAHPKCTFLECAIGKQRSIAMRLKRAKNQSQPENCALNENMAKNHAECTLYSFPTHNNNNTLLGRLLFRVELRELRLLLRSVGLLFKLRYGGIDRRRVHTIGATKMTRHLHLLSGRDRHDC